MSIANVGSVGVTVVPDARGFKEKVHALLGNLSIHVDLDTTAATAHLDELTAKLDRLAIRSPSVDVDVKTLGAETSLGALGVEIGLLIGEMAGLEGDLVGLGVELEAVGQIGTEALGEVDAAAAAADAETGGLGIAMAILAGIAIAVLAPALIPVAAVLTAIAGGLLAVGGLATLGLLPLIAAVVAATGGLDPKNSTLFASLAKDFKAFGDSVKPQVLAVVKDFLHVLDVLLPTLAPLVRVVAPALEAILTSLSGAIVGPGFAAFMFQLEQLAPGALVAIAGALGGIARGVGSLIIALGPTGIDVLNGLTRFLSGAGGFGQSQGFQTFLQYARDNLPAVKKLFSDIFGFIGHIIDVLAPFGPVAIAAIDVLVTWLNQTFLPAFAHVLHEIVAGTVNLINVFHGFSDFVLGVFGGIVNGAADAFGWLPQIGQGLKDAQVDFNNFKTGFDRAMDSAATSAQGLLDKLDALNVDVRPNIDFQILANGKPVPPGFIGPVLTLSNRALATDKKLNAKGLAGGGLITGSGGPTSDSVPTWTSPGEFVVQAAAVNKWGLAAMQSLNAGQTVPGSGTTVVQHISGPGVEEVARATVAELRKRDLLYPVG